MPDVQRYLREEERERWIHAKNTIENSEVGRKIQESWSDSDVWVALSDQPGHEIAVLWAWRVKRFLEYLSACRALLKKCEWAGCFEYWKQVDIGNGTTEQLFTAPACPACKNTKKNGHKPDCAIAAQLKGTRE